MGLLGLFRRRGYQGPVSNHFDGKHFEQPGLPFDAGPRKVLKWMLTRKKAVWPKQIPQPPPARPVESIGSDRVVMTFVNHSTFLIQSQGLNILTDPVWSERASPFRFFGPKRLVQPGIRYEDLPPIHVVLISHNHYDHIDVETLRRLARDHRPRFIGALGDATWLHQAGVPGVEEMDWWQSVELKPGVRATFTPSQHWSGRGFFDRCMSLWGSFMLGIGDQGFFFAGDTGYGAHFKQIAERFPKVRVALLPIGAYEPRWFMKYQHTNPDDAVLAHMDLQAQDSIGIHFGCFQLTDEQWDSPQKDLAVALEKYRVNPRRFQVPEPGKSFSFML